jgi:hypothetical protein
VIVVADEQILQGVPATITGVFYDQHGIAAPPAGTVTVGVTASDGTVVLAAGTTTTAGGDGAYKVALTASQTAALDVLTATWTASGGAVTTSVVEIVGGYWFSVAEARTHSGLGDSGAVTDAKIIEKRREVEQEAERIIGAAFVPRFRQVTVWGTGTGSLVMPDPVIRTVRSVSFAGVSLSAAALANIVAGADGTLTGYWPTLAVGEESWSSWGSRFPSGTRVAVGYEHGLDRPPADLKRVALRRLRSIVNAEKSGVPDRAVTFTTGEGGTYSLATPGTRDWHTGIPEVDDVYGSYRDLYRGHQRSGSVPIG